MKQPARHHKTQLAVIGTGLAGFAASIFALDRGISTAQVGNTGAVAYTTGYLDLLGVGADGVLDNPWAGLESLRHNEPNHPLSKIADDDIKTAFSLFTHALCDMGVKYTQPGEENVMALLPVGVVKPTLSVPRTMLPGIKAHQLGCKALIVGFAGLQGFSPEEFLENFRPGWPQLTTVTLTFPEMENGAQVYPEVMARALEVPAIREQLAERIKANLGNSECLGLPAILGIHAPDAVHVEMEERVGLPIFEIPTIPPSVPGIRLREMFERTLPEKGLTLVPQHKANRINCDARGVTLYLEDSFGDVVIEAQAAILATGRFLSGGLTAGRDKIRETLLDIPVTQPDSRSDWHRQIYFDPRGHPVNRSGIEIDDHCRPLTRDEKPVGERLFAAGTLLAHQDWVRQRCGAGIAIASAYKAVQAASETLESVI
jgi:glycerol-3-phosphate dehydrogenase subunit B